MDTPETITHVSLCAGYGGIDLGLRRAVPGLRTVAFAEIEAFACANLVAKMEAGQLDVAPVWTNLKTFPWGKFHGCVDILSGGYPCQPFSSAGKRLGKDDPRHLWPWIADGILAMRPRVCFFENVEGHISLGLEQVIADLGGLGYTATWGIFSAAEVGAPHQRKRVFILAHCNESGCEGSFGIGPAGAQGTPSGHATECSGDVAHTAGIRGGQNNWLGVSGFTDQADAVWPSRPGQPQHEWEPPRVVGNKSDDLGDSEGQRARGLSIGEVEAQSGFEGASFAGETTFISIGQTQPALGRDADGSAGRLGYAELCVSGDNRTDELRLLGNGVVPAAAERAFRVLAGRLLT